MSKRDRNQNREQSTETDEQDQPNLADLEGIVDEIEVEMERVEIADENMSAPPTEAEIALAESILARVPAKPGQKQKRVLTAAEQEERRLKKNKALNDWRKINRERYNAYIKRWRQERAEKTVNALDENERLKQEIAMLRAPLAEAIDEAHDESEAAAS